MNEGSLIHLAHCNTDLIEAQRHIYLAFQSYAQGSDVKMEQDEYELMKDGLKRVKESLRAVEKTYDIYNNLSDIRAYEKGVSER